MEDQGTETATKDQEAPGQNVDRTRRREIVLRSLNRQSTISGGELLLPIGALFIYDGCKSGSIAFIAIGLILCVVGARLQFAWWAQGRAANAEIDAVLREAQAEDVGLILRLRGIPEGTITHRTNVTAAFNTALSRVGPNDHISLSDQQRDTLRSMVVGSNIELALNVLNAFEHIGNAGDCATVGRVVSGASPVQSERIMDRAKEVLPVMQERIRRARAGTGLLRASSAPDGDTLLRGHIDPGDEHPETLMRAVE